jgi:hypothetical protein
MKTILIGFAINVVIAFSAYFIVDQTYFGARLVGDIVLKPMERIISAKCEYGQISYETKKQPYAGRELKVCSLYYMIGPFHYCKYY